MRAGREAVYSALFALLTGAAEFVTTGRRAQALAQLQPSVLPALFQQQVWEETTQTNGIPPKYTLHVDIYVYAANPDTSQPSSPQLNALLDAIETALAPSPVTGRQTLGGLVSHCFINGRTDILEGDLGNRVAALVPVEILCT